MIDTQAQDLGFDLCKFVDASPTPFHAVAEMRRRLDASGFKELSETELWNPTILFPEAGGQYYVVRGGTSLIAFVVGSLSLMGGFKIIGAHTDSPTLRLKPNALYSSAGYLQAGIEPYGGGVWRTWIDRDLGIAGRIVVRSPDGELSARLVRTGYPVVSIPGLAIHLDREVNEKGGINCQSDLPPVLSLSYERGVEDFSSVLLRGVVPWKCKIVSTALSLYDLQKSSLSGMNEEFIRAGRLDNLASCHEALTALLHTKNPKTTCVVSFWDHEEVGSNSSQGAGGTFLRDVLSRLVSCKNGGSLRDNYYSIAIAHSFCISADLAHAVHPNHPEKHEPRHVPKIGGGPVIKWNVNQSYATDDISAAIFSDICDEAGVAYQPFVSRSDMRCGSTIGPITATGLGVRTVDVGIPLLSMHSIREMAGVADHLAMKKVFEVFFAREKESVAFL